MSTLARPLVGATTPADRVLPTAHRRRPPLPRWWRDATAALGWAVLLFVTALWVAGGGVQDLGSMAGFLTSTGRLTGLVASALLLLQVLLMARVPWVEQAWGQDELARTHRLVGFTSFTLMLAHVVDGDDVWMLQTGGGAGLGLKSLDGFCTGELAEGEQLHRHDAVQVDLPCAIDHAHAALADLFQQLVIAETLTSAFRLRFAGLPQALAEQAAQAIAVRRGVIQRDATTTTCMFAGHKRSAVPAFTRFYNRTPPPLRLGPGGTGYIVSLSG